MWQAWTNNPRTGTEYAQHMTELLYATTTRVIFSTGGLVVLLVTGLAATYPEHYRWNLVPGFLLTLAVCGLAYVLMRRAFLLSQAVWLAGLTGAVLFFAASFEQPELMLLLALLPLMAVATLGWRGGLLALVWLLLLNAWVLPQPGLPPLQPGYRTALLAGGLLCGLLGWASTSSLVTVMDWFLYTYRSQQENLEEARSHRARLNLALKQLDQTNHQLQSANASLAAAWRTAEQAERFKAEFVSNVSHELRTPLNLIIGFAETMVTSPESYGSEVLPGGYRADIFAIYNSAKHLRALVDDVLDLGRIDASKIALVLSDVPVPPFIAEVEAMVRDYITTKGIDLQVQIAEGLPALRLDRLRVRQVLLNLLVNATRFTERGSIRLIVSRRENRVAFRVEDSGRGIPPEDLPHVFEPFHTTGHQAEAPWHSGTGLGLPISKKFIEMHGGQMGVESSYPQGAAFWFDLPCEQCSAAQAPGWLETGSGENGQPAGARPVVVVHPDPSVAAGLQRQILQFQFLPAGSLAEGLELAQQTRAAAVLHDLETLPPAACGSRIPLISLPYPTGPKIAARAGADDLLIKPVTAEQLLAALDRLDRPVRRLLIVDDDPGLIRLFRRILQVRLPAQNLLEAYDAPSALAIVRTEWPDAVLLDSHLPQQGVQQFLTQLQQLPPGPGEGCRPPVILIGESWEEWENLPQPVQVWRGGGFRSGELADLTRAVLESLAGAWPGLDSGTGAPPAGFAG